MSTTLWPKGWLRFKEESNRDIEENVPEEGEMVKPATESMTSIDTWLHLYPSILNQGRLTHMPLPESETIGADGEPLEAEAVLAKTVAKDPWENRLKPAGDDDAVQGGLPAWILRSANVEGNVQLDPQFGRKPKNFGTVYVKSLWWPGAYNFYHAEKPSFLYVGDGHKHETRKYYPTEIPVMMADRDEKPTADEPNPTDAWLKAKADAEAAAAKQQE